MKKSNGTPKNTNDNTAILVVQNIKWRSLKMGIQSENYDKPVQTNVEAWILLVLHSCVQSKKTPVGGCHNGLFGVYGASAQ